MESKLHRFVHDISSVSRPQQFTWPFHYVPHPLCTIAANELQNYVQSRQEWAEELELGKMLGVLVVEDPDGTLGFLAAFSGNLAGDNNHDYFVPPIHDLLNPDGEFKRGEHEISAINHCIDALERSPQRQQLIHVRSERIKSQEQELEHFKQIMEQGKQRRHTLREEGHLTAEQEAELIRESQFQKAELKRLKLRHLEQLADIDTELSVLEHEIQELRKERKLKSEALQSRLFDLYIVNNARGQQQSLSQIFADFAKREDKPRYAIPPGGAGECCAPKLLQYAYQHQLRPVCMAEFWWGNSPAGEVRHHGHYYPACRSKCLPILTFMLQGLDVEPNPLADKCQNQLEELYDDSWLTVVNKPEGMLSEPGKLLSDSALTRFMERHPEATGPVLVHRLDQETSGLLIFAKDKDTHKELQRQFAEREVRKEYIAWLDGFVQRDGGIIDLPLRPNADDRPRQVVDFELGKQAVTHFEVMERRPDGITLVLFTPRTGRTHQLRVHASHPLGLGCPIVGDMLYGKAATRLMLHATSITFVHPVTGEQLTIRCPFTPPE
ncbi:MAG: RNA pseudouridine synthase [Muribaculaceae bacterium]|nr:RNA pseudouridine synthase [Muribaculaceae bacterium]